MKEKNWTWHIIKAVTSVQTKGASVSLRNSTIKTCVVGLKFLPSKYIVIFRVLRAFTFAKFFKLAKIYKKKYRGFHNCKLKQSLSLVVCTVVIICGSGDVILMQNWIHT